MSIAGPVAATNYHGTNPGGTVCGNGSHTTELLYSTPIVYGSTTIGRVELRQSKYCATVWSRVYNLTSSSLQAHETIVLYSTPNGDGRTEYQYPTVDTLGAGGSGWSNQYQDRPSFSAKAGLYYAGAWRWTETYRSPAWVQDHVSYPNNPWSCNHTSSNPCYRWPTDGTGISTTRFYNIGLGIYALPSDGSTTYNAADDVRFMFRVYNAVPAPSPFMYEGQDILHAQVFVYDYYEAPQNGLIAYARAHGSAPAGTSLYNLGELKMNDAFTSWGPSADVRNLLCHEIGHVMGEWDNTMGSYVGSRAGCMSGGLSAGPSYDDQLALNSIYRSSAP